MTLTPPQSFDDLIGPTASGTTPFQNSHGVGQSFWSAALRFLEQKLNDGQNRGISADGEFNLSMLPTTERGGAVLGVAVHRGNHVAAFNQLVYNVDDELAPNFFNQVISKLDAELMGATTPEAEDTTVISFRGTDRAFGWTGSDGWNGWGVGAGACAGDQARLGQAFFQAVTGTTDGEARDGNALLTGHSLGGGSVLGG